MTGLMLDSSGNLYGTAWSGGTHNGGVVFELSPTKRASWTYTALYNFCNQGSCADGEFPASQLLMDQTGNLIGTAEFGGAHGGGVLFKLAPTGSSWHYNVLYSFCTQAACNDGAQPLGTLAMDDDGNIYGAAQAGGSKVEAQSTNLMVLQFGRYTPSAKLSVPMAATPMGLLATGRGTSTAQRSSKERMVSEPYSSYRHDC